MRFGNKVTLTLKSIKSLFKEELYGLTSQIRRASSIQQTLVKDVGETVTKFNQFLNIALGSACETEYLLILSKI
jgi:four helix bundle protein